MSDKHVPDATQQRAHMSLAWSAYHTANRAVMIHRRRWAVESRQYVEQLDAYFDALQAAATEDLVPNSVREAGLHAERVCSLSHQRLQQLTAQRHVALTHALAEMGRYHGAAMATDPDGDTARRYWRHARRMARTLRHNMPHARVVGIEPEFASAAGWAHAMGLRNVEELMAMLKAAGVRQTCRLAGRQ